MAFTLIGGARLLLLPPEGGTIHDAADFALTLRTVQSLPPEGLLTLGFDPTRFQAEPPACYRASWQLPGPDLHRQATASLCWISYAISTSNSGRTLRTAERGIMHLVEYEIEVTFRSGDESGHAEVVKRLFDAFHATHPDADAITSVRPDGMVELSFSVEASGPNEAYERMRPIFLDGMQASGIDMEQLEPVDLLITRVTEDNAAHESARELQPA